MARPSHPGHSTILLQSESPSGMCAKLRTVAAIEITCRDHSIVASSCHIHMVLFFAHIPFVVNRAVSGEVATVWL